MDLRMPGMGGVEATRILRLEHPDARVLVLTTFDHDELLFAALQAGACGYLLKDCSAILAKLRVSDRTRAALEARDRGLLGPGGRQAS